MADESISVISLDDISCNEKTLDKLKETVNYPLHEGETATSQKEKSEELIQIGVEKSQENSIYVVDVPDLPNNKEDEEKGRSSQPNSKKALRSFFLSVGMIAISVFLLIPWITIPRTDSIAYQSYWWELCLPLASLMFLNTANNMLNLTVWTKENSLGTPLVFAVMFLLNYVLQTLIHMTCYFVWSVTLGLNHPMPFYGIVSLLILEVSFQIGLWTLLPSKLLKKEGFRRKLRIFMIYRLWVFLMVFQNEVLSYLFLNPPADLQVLVPFIIFGCREFDLKVRSKIVNKMMGEKDETGTALLEITLHVLYGSFIAIRLAEAEFATVCCVVAIQFFLHMKTTHRIVCKHNRVEVKKLETNETQQNFELVHLVAVEIVEGFIPIIHGICIAMAYYGPNANLLTNIGTSYWGDEIDDFGLVFISMMVLLIFDALFAVVTSLWIWKTMDIDMLQEFQRVLAKYWLPMVINLAFLEVAYVSITDINFGMDSTGKFAWIDDEGWKSLINATKSLTNEEKILLLNSTI